MPFDSGEVSRELKIARVKVKRKVKVPALSAIKVSCSLDQPMEEYYTESEVNHLMVPRTVQNGENTTNLWCFSTVQIKRLNCLEAR